MIYLDNAAAALPDGETAGFFARALQKYGANQEAAHKEGYLLRQEIRQASAALSTAVTGSPGWQVIWCSSATEAFHIFSHCSGCSGKRILSSALEHPALTAALKRISGDICLLQPDRKTGQLHLPDDTNCAIAAFHLVQSETGIIQDTERLFAPLSGAIRFLDAVQAACKMKIPCRHADIIAVSGNKFGAPGAAALLLSPDCPDSDTFFRRAEKMRSAEYLLGRVTPAAILTCAFAAAGHTKKMERFQIHAAKLNHLLREGAKKLGLVPTIPAEYASSCIVHLLAPGFQGGVLVRMLSEEGVLISSGSACASETKEPSPALTALGYDRKDAYSGLRISFDFATTEDDVKFLLSSLEKVLKKY